MTERGNIPLDGLGMTREAMLELVNRMNKAFPEKYVFSIAPACGGARNAFNPLCFSGPQQSMANPLFAHHLGS